MDKQANIHKDQEEGLLDNPDRRKLFKWGAAAAGVAVTGAAGGWVTYRVQGGAHETFPVEIDDSILQPFDQRNMVFSYAISQKLQKEYPERNRAFAKEIGIPDFTFTDVMKSLKHHQSVDPDAWDNSTLGYRQLDWALGTAANGPLGKFLGPYSKFGVPNTGEHTWEQFWFACDYCFEPGLETADTA